MATAVAAVVGGAFSAMSAGKAADAQADAAQAGLNANKYATDESLKFQREALAQEREMFDQALAMGEPYRTAGERALAQYESFLYGTKLQQKAPTQYNYSAFEQAMQRYANSTAAPRTLDAKQYKALSPAEQKNFKLQNGKYVEDSTGMKMPSLDDFSIDPNSPYDLAGYQSALDTYKSSSTMSSAKPLSKKEWQKLTPEEQAKYQLSGKTYSLKQDKSSMPKLEDFKNKNFGQSPALGGEPVPFDDVDQARMEALMKTPGYQFQMNEGEKALERGAAARSGALSGAASKALTRFGQGLASTSYDSFMNRLAGIADAGREASAGGANAALTAGSTSAGILGNMGNTMMQSGANAASLYSQQGAAQASGYLGQNAAMSSALRGIDFSQFGSLGGGSAGGDLYDRAVAAQPAMQYGWG